MAKSRFLIPWFFSYNKSNTEYQTLFVDMKGAEQQLSTATKSNVYDNRKCACLATNTIKKNC